MNESESDLVEVIFLPIEKIVRVTKGTSLLKAANKASIFIDTPCGGHGSCRKCKVLIKEVSSSTEIHSSNSKKEWKYQLACQTKIIKNLVVDLQDKFPSSLYASSRQKIAKLNIFSKSKIRVRPNLKKMYLELSPQTLDNQIADLELILSNLKLKINDYNSLSFLKSLPTILRESDYKVTALLLNSEKKLLNVEPGNTVKDLYGVALDIGTTTISAVLVNLNNGEKLAEAITLNKQIAYGWDVISRIGFIMRDKEGITKLHSKVVETINELIENLCIQSNLSPEKIYEITAVGNTTMLHLFLGILPISLGYLPHVPVFRGPLYISAKENKININPYGIIYILPNIAGFVGADTVGLILYTNLHKSDQVKLVIDLGTNGEIILGNKEKIICCSTAAGPAFEGAKIECGMIASSGAIDTVWEEDGYLRISTIDNVLPKGICGSGLIDAVATLLDLGIIDSSGKIIHKNERKHKLNINLKDAHSSLDTRIFLTQDGKIYLTQKDIRELQLAKAAIYSGIKILLNQLQISEDAVSEVLIAGTFGNYINPENIAKIKLIPLNLAKKIKFIGNGALGGAYLSLISLAKRKEIDIILKKAEHLELAALPEFQEVFTDAIAF